MSGNVDPDGLMEFSVVFTDRSLNHMSKQFQQVMRDIHAGLCEVYKAETAVVVPGGGTFGMEAVARAFGREGKMVIVRNGWFSFRWTQIVDQGGFPVEQIVHKARRQGNEPASPFAPAPVEEVVESIRREKPAVVVAPHVETSAGIILPDDYIRALSDAAHEVGALMVLDCIASGCAWVDMQATGVDVLISAPQKGWSSTPCAGLVMLSEEGAKRARAAQSDSFSADLPKWLSIMQAYLDGGHAYHATMPTDGLKQFRDTLDETRAFGFEAARAAQWKLGDAVRGYVKEKGVTSVAAEGFGAPGVVVSYTGDAGVQNGSKFAAQGMQIAAGVPLKCDEPEGFSTFRLGLFGLDKLKDVDATMARLTPVLDRVL